MKMRKVFSSLLFFLLMGVSSASFGTTTLVHYMTGANDRNNKASAVEGLKSVGQIGRSTDAGGTPNGGLGVRDLAVPDGDGGNAWWSYTTYTLRANVPSNNTDDASRAPGLKNSYSLFTTLSLEEGYHAENLSLSFVMGGRSTNSDVGAGMILSATVWYNLGSGWTVFDTKTLDATSEYAKGSDATPYSFTAGTLTYDMGSVDFSEASTIQLGVSFGASLGHNSKQMWVSQFKVEGDVVPDSIPEPSFSILGMLGIAVLGMRRRRGQ